MKNMGKKHNSEMKKVPVKHVADMCPRGGKKCADEAQMKRGYK